MTEYNDRQKKIFNNNERVITDEVADVEGLVVGPEGVVDAWVPALVNADYVVGGGGGGEEEEEGGGEVEERG